MTRVAVVLLLVHHMAHVAGRVVVIVLTSAAGFIVMVARETARNSLVHSSALEALFGNALAEAATVWLVARAHLRGAENVATLLVRRLSVMVALRVLRLHR